MRKRIYVIIAIVVYSITIKKAFQQTKALGVFLVISSIKKRVVTVLNNIGLTSLYQTIQRLLIYNTEAQKQAAIKIARSEQSYITYNNFNRQQKRRDQVIGDVNKQVNITTSFIAVNPYIPKTSLTKDIIDFLKPLDGLAIIQSIYNDKYIKPTTLYYIDQALDYLFYYELLVIFKDSDKKRFEQVELDELLAVKIKLFSLPISIHNEVSVQGTYAIYNNIFLNSLKLDREKDFEKRIQLVVGNNITVQRGQTI